MRSILLCTLALAGIAIVTDVASAGIIFGRKKNQGGDCCGGSAPAAPCCGQSAAYGPQYGQQYGPQYGQMYGATASCCGNSVAYGPGSNVYMGGQTAGISGQNVIQGTDGTYYYRGTDGSYYTSPQGVTGTWPGQQPYYYGTMNRPGYYMQNGVYQAGYPGTQNYFPGNIIPAGGLPLQMPTVPGLPRR